MPSVFQMLNTQTPSIVYQPFVILMDRQLTIGKPVLVKPHCLLPPLISFGVKLISNDSNNPAWVFPTIWTRNLFVPRDLRAVSRVRKQGGNSVIPILLKCAITLHIWVIRFPYFAKSIKNIFYITQMTILYLKHTRVTQIMEPFFHDRQ